MALEHRAHLGELREDQRAFAAREYLLQHLRQPRELARAAGNRGVVLEELRRMIADLLELGERREHQPLALDALAASRPGFRLFDHGGIERSLLLRQRAEDLHLELFGQVRDDRLVGLQAAQNERRGQRLRWSAASWSREAWIGMKNFRLNSAGVPSSPGLRNSISDHRSPTLFSTGVPVSATR